MYFVCVCKYFTIKEKNENIERSVKDVSLFCVYKTLLITTQIGEGYSEQTMVAVIRLRDHTHVAFETRYAKYFVSKNNFVAYDFLLR